MNRPFNGDPGDMFGHDLAIFEFISYPNGLDISLEDLKKHLGISQSMDIMIKPKKKSFLYQLDVDSTYGFKSVAPSISSIYYENIVRDHQIP